MSLWTQNKTLSCICGKKKISLLFFPTWCSSSSDFSKVWIGSNMKKGLHPQQKFGSVDLLLRLYLCKKMLTMTSHFKLPLIGNISFFSKAKLCLWWGLCVVFAIGGGWASWLRLGLSIESSYLIKRGIILLQEEMKLNKSLFMWSATVKLRGGNYKPW